MHNSDTSVSLMEHLSITGRYPVLIREKDMAVPDNMQNLEIPTPEVLQAQVMQCENECEILKRNLMNAFAALQIEWEE